MIEEEELVEDYDNDAVNGGMDLDNPMNGNHEDSTDYDQGNIVTSGEAAEKALNTVKGIKDKKISNDKRTTTPYMTKYERARVLGTRALQIR